MAVIRGHRTTPHGSVIIEKELKNLLDKYNKKPKPDKFEKILVRSFCKVLEAVTDDALIACEAWLCSFCFEIFLGRDYDEAGLVTCDHCDNIVCDSCAETHIKKKGETIVCNACS